jgi:hypothetical protein
MIRGFVLCRKYFQIDHANSKTTKQLEGGPGVKPGFAASDAAVLFDYTTHPSGTRAGNPTRISSLGPKRHHALDHASLINVEGMQRIEL